MDFFCCGYYFFDVGWCVFDIGLCQNVSLCEEVLRVCYKGNCYNIFVNGDQLMWFEVCIVFVDQIVQWMYEVIVY